MVGWDPYTASTEINSNGKLLTDGEGLTTDRDFFMATESFINANEEITDIIIEEVKKSSDWANNNHEELIAMLEPILKLDEESIRMTVESRVYGVDDIMSVVIIDQQVFDDSLFIVNVFIIYNEVTDIMDN